MLKKSRRPAHRLTSIVENVVEARQSLEQKPREDLDARRMPQIEPVNLQPIAKAGEVRLLRVTIRGVDRKSGGDDDVRTGPQQLERSLEPDLHAGAGHERVMPRQVGRLLALRIVEVA